MFTLVCIDSLSGIFSGIFEAWKGRYPKDEVTLKVAPINNYELFMEYVEVSEDEEAVQKVMRTLQRRFGEEVYLDLCYALWSNAEDKADAVYRTIRYGFENHLGSRLLDHQTQPFVNRVYELRRAVWNEAHHYLGFLRFSELEEGVLYGKVEPHFYILEILAEHFVDRLPQENWMIEDLRHGFIILHEAGKAWSLLKLDQEQKMVIENMDQKVTREERYYSELWRMFCHKISIEARHNPNLQRQNMPFRFRGNMTEF